MNNTTMEQQTPRQRLQIFLESDTLSARLWSLFINALILTSIVQLAGEYGILNINLTTAQHRAADLTIASIFAIEYLLRLWAAPRRLKFIINVFSIIDLLAIVPSFLGFGQAKGLRMLRILRTLRLLRLLRLIRLIRSLEIVDRYRKDSDASKEVAYYKTLLDAFRQLPEKPIAQELRGRVEPLIAATTAVMTATNRHIEQGSEAGTADDKQIFYISFYELARQIQATLKLLVRNARELDLWKFHYLLQELGLLLKSEHTTGPVEELNDVQPGRDFQFLQLIRISVRDILITFSVAVGLNVIIRLSPFSASLDPFLEHLSLIEGAMAVLIVFITSFNMSYTNAKRGNTDLAIIDFTNLLVIYAERIRALATRVRRDPRELAGFLGQVDHYMGCIGLDIINGVRQGNAYRLRFDTAALQSFDRIKAAIGPELAKVDEVTRNRMEEIHDDLVGMLNKFQTMSTIRAAVIFNALNHWIIRITYFLLAVLSPLSVLPRLFLVNLMQRAFYKTANETDNAIFNISLAKLPIADRVLRRLCRISGVLQD